MRRMMVLTATFAVAGGLFAAAPATAGVPQTTTGGCEAGSTPAPLAGVTTLADGGKVYKYRIAGEINEVPVPPAGFNPLTASAKALSTYGLPARPAASAAAATKTQWTTRMRAFKRPSDPGLCVTAYRTQRAGTTAGKLLNWAGFTEYHKASRSYYVGATGDFVQTKAKASCAGATWTGWVGIGGYYSGGGLIQAGSYRGSGGGVHAFYEYLDNKGKGPNVINMPSVKVKNGQHIHASVIYQRSSKLTTFYVYDTTNGTYQTVKKTLAAKYYDGRTAEQVDERLTVNKALSNLYHFGTDPWTHSRAMRSSDGKWHGLSSQAHAKITMVNSSGQTLAAPGAASGQSFKDAWKRCK